MKTIDNTNPFETVNTSLNFEAAGSPKSISDHLSKIPLSNR